MRFPGSIRHQKQIALFRPKMTVTFPVERGAVRGPARTGQSKLRTQILHNMLAGFAGCPPKCGTRRRETFEGFSA
jgi:hypothetical protein